MVGVAQLAEHRVVAPVVEGSSPFTHPINSELPFSWKWRDFRRQSKKLIMQGARILRNEAYMLVRCNDER